jgi:capsular exopolysaccharide synthesis family protein
MSRNFELLQQLQKQPRAFTPSANAFARAADPAFVPGANPMTYPCSRRLEVDPHKISREEITKLVQRIFLCSKNGNERRAVLFAGIDDDSGSSLICASGGQTLAQQVTGNVCIVDANLRCPSVHRHFGVENSHGLADALLEARPIENLAKPLARGNLWLVPGGCTPPNPTTVSGSELLRGLGQLRTQFDYLLVNVPPAGTYADAVVIGKIADGVVLVVEANSTKRETARQVKASLEAANVRLLGAVLNQRTFPIPETIYRRL